MCRKHQPKQMYTKPDAKTQFDMALAYTLRGLGQWIMCGECGLTGCVTDAGDVRWYTPGTVGFISQGRDLAKAAAWNEKVVSESVPV